MRNLATDIYASNLRNITCRRGIFFEKGLILVKHFTYRLTPFHFDKHHRFWEIFVDTSSSPKTPY